MTVTPHPHAGNDGETHSIRWLGLALAALLIGYAVYVAAARTAGLSWPYDADHFRDVAASETVLRHGLGQDPYYRGEAGWYNPLLPGLMAAIAAVSGLDLPVLYARAGTFLNIGAPPAARCAPSQPMRRSSARQRCRSHRRFSCRSSFVTASTS